MSIKHYDGNRQWHGLVCQRYTLANTEKQIITEKLNQLKQLLLARSLSYSGQIDLWASKQTESYYWGPIPVKQTLQCINGSSSTQSYYAEKIGTTTAGSDLAPMVNYINTQIGNKRYIIMENPNVAAWQNYVNYAVANRMPNICRLRFTANGWWEYSTKVHYLNTGGWTDYGAYIYLTDPNIKNVIPGHSGRYYTHVNELYFATQNHPRKQIAY